MSDLLKDKLRDLRIRNSLTQSYIASYLNMTRAAYGHYENGKRTPDYQTLLKLAKLYHIDINELINYSTTPVPDDRVTEEVNFRSDKTNPASKDSIQREVFKSVLSEYERKLIGLYRMLPAKDRDLEIQREIHRLEEKIAKNTR